MSEPSRKTEALRAWPRMFESDWLDRLSRVHPSVPPVIFGPLIVGFTIFAATRRGLALGAGLVVAGYFLWTLTGYWMHRLIFHFEPEDGIGARLHWIIHGIHHDHPNDPLRLVMPPSVSLPLAVVFYLLFLLVFGDRRSLRPGARGRLHRRLPDLRHDPLLRPPPPDRPARPDAPRVAHAPPLPRRHDRVRRQRPLWDRVFGTAPARGQPD
jgi:sterol desaturase/sphingolipid hydroxylase (fatty acid hydroxylase superfamily)